MSGAGPTGKSQLDAESWFLGKTLDELETFCANNAEADVLAAEKHAYKCVLKSVREFKQGINHADAD